MILALPLAFGAVCAVQERPQPDRRALLVGIGDYAAAAGGWEDLLGPPRDVELMREVLVGRFGFAAEEVVVLRDAEARHAAIVDAFWEHLIADAGPGTEAIFYFSGHGSRAPDASGREPSGYDSTLVCHDSARGAADAAPDLTDDELHSLLAALAARGANATLITDCCHSGGLTRGDAVARSLPPAAAGSDPAAFLPPEVPLLEDGDLRRAESVPWVHVAGCAPGQRAHEGKVENGLGERMTHGLLTWHLAAALREAQPGTSWEELIEVVSAALQEQMWSEGAARTQRPAAAGQVRRMVFGGGFAAPLPGFPAHAQGGRGFLRVEAGTLAFLEADTRLEVRSLAGEVLGEARVHRTRVWPTRCEAVWEQEPADLAAGTALRVLPLDAPAAHPPVPVYAPPGSAAAAALEECARDGNAVLVGEGEAALRFGAAEGAQWRAVDPASGATIWKWSEEGASALARLQAALRGEQRWRRWMSHPEAQALGALEMDWRTVDDERRAGLEAWVRSPCVAAALRAGDGDADVVVVRDGERRRQVVDLVVRLPEGSGAAGGFLSVLCISEDHSVTPIFPADRDQERGLAPGQEILIAAEVFVPDGWPAGLPQRDRYVALLTTEPIRIEALGQASGMTLRGGARAPARLEAMLAADGLRGGSAARVEAGASDYSFARLDLLLVRE